MNHPYRDNPAVKSSDPSVECVEVDVGSIELKIYYGDVALNSSITRSFEGKCKGSLAFVPAKQRSFNDNARRFAQYVTRSAYTVMLEDIKQSFNTGMMIIPDGENAGTIIPTDRIKLLSYKQVPKLITVQVTRS